MSTATTIQTSTESTSGDIFKDFGDYKTIALATATSGVTLLILIYIGCRWRCRKRKTPQERFYEKPENSENSEFHEYVEFTGTVAGDIKDNPDNLEETGSQLALDLDPDNYLSARPSGYFDQFPAPPKSWITPKDSGSESKPEVTSVDTTSNGVSVKIQNGPWHKTIDIKFN